VMVRANRHNRPLTDVDLVVLRCRPQDVVDLRRPAAVHATALGQFIPEAFLRCGWLVAFSPHWYTPCLICSRLEALRLRQASNFAINASWRTRAASALSMASAAF